MPHFNLNQVIFGLVMALPVFIVGTASAQEPLQFFDPFGNSINIHGSRLQPGASVAIPGTVEEWEDPNTGARGIRWRGIDGQMHGDTTFQNPDGTSQSHSYAALPGSGGGANRATMSRRMPNGVVPNMNRGLPNGVVPNMNRGLPNGVVPNMNRGLPNGVVPNMNRGLPNGVVPNMNRGLPNGVVPNMNRGMSNGVVPNMNRGMPNGLVPNANRGLPNGLRNFGR